MPNDADFVRAMREDPESDATLLIYADWLEEQGQVSRADLIRVQVERSRRDGTDLLTRNETKWRADELPKIPGLHWSHFDRGMVWSVTVEKLEIFVENAPAIFAVAPIIGVHDRGIYSSEIAKIADSPHFELTRWLRIDARPIVSADFEALLHSPSWTSLKRLELRRVQFTIPAGPFPFRDAQAEVLAQSPLLPRLEGLTLMGNDLTDDGLRMIAAAPGPCRLKTINLWQARPESFRGIYWSHRAYRASRMTHGEPRGSFTQAGVEALLRSPRFPDLHRLDCDWSRLPDEFRQEAFQILAERTRRRRSSDSDSGLDSGAP